MSRTINLFIRSARPIDEVAAEIQRLTRFAVEPRPDGSTWDLREGGVEAALRAHRYMNDGELVLERYQYTLECRVGNETRLVDAAETALLRVVSEALQSGGFATLLVHDLQYHDGPAPRADSEDPGHAAPAPA